MADIHSELLRYVDEWRKRAKLNSSIVHKENLWLDLSRVDDVALKVALQVLEEQAGEPFHETITVLELLSVYAMGELEVVNVHEIQNGKTHEKAKTYVNNISKEMEKAELTRSELVNVVFTTKWWVTTLHLQQKFIERSFDIRRWQINATHF